MPGSEYIPTVFNSYTPTATVDGVRVSVPLWDTRGNTDYDRLRPLSYPGTDVFLLCFSLARRATRLSFLPHVPSSRCILTSGHPHPPPWGNTVESVRTRWVPEVRAKGPADALLVLVGITGTTPAGDSRAEEEEEDSNDNDAVAPVGHAEGAAAARDIGASRYLVCNLLDVSSVNAVVREAVRVARRGGSRSGCVLQ